MEGRGGEGAFEVPFEQMLFAGRVPFRCAFACGWLVVPITEAATAVAGSFEQSYCTQERKIHTAEGTRSLHNDWRQHGEKIRRPTDPRDTTSCPSFRKEPVPTYRQPREVKNLSFRNILNRVSQPFAPEESSS